MVKRIMNILFLSCLKATELIEKKLHFKLTLTEKGQLKMHTMMCDACRRYEKQNHFIENSLKFHDYAAKSEKDVEQLKKLIKEKIEK